MENLITSQKKKGRKLLFNNRSEQGSLSGQIKLISFNILNQEKNTVERILFKLNRLRTVFIQFSPITTREVKNTKCELFRRFVFT